MSAALVQSATQQNTGVNTTIALAGVAAGNTLILMQSVLDFTAAGTTLPVPTDTGGTFVSALNPAPTLDTGGNRTTNAIFIQVNAAAGTHTVTPGMFGVAANNQALLTLIEVSGMSAAPIVDGSDFTSSQNVVSSTKFASGTTGLLNSTNSIAFAMITFTVSTGAANMGLLDPPTNWIRLGVNQASNTSIPGMHCYKIPRSDARLTASWTYTADATMRSALGAILTLQPAQTGGNYSGWMLAPKIRKKASPFTSDISDWWR